MGGGASTGGALDDSKGSPHAKGVTLPANWSVPSLGASSDSIPSSGGQYSSDEFSRMALGLESPHKDKHRDYKARPSLNHPSEQSWRNPDDIAADIDGQHQPPEKSGRKSILSPPANSPHPPSQQKKPPPVTPSTKGGFDQSSTGTIRSSLSGTPDSGRLKAGGPKSRNIGPPGASVHQTVMAPTSLPIPSSPMPVQSSRPSAGNIDFATGPTRDVRGLGPSAQRASMAEARSVPASPVTPKKTVDESKEGFIDKLQKLRPMNINVGAPVHEPEYKVLSPTPVSQRVDHRADFAAKTLPVRPFPTDGNSPDDVMMAYFGKGKEEAPKHTPQLDVHIPRLDIGNSVALTPPPRGPSAQRTPSDESKLKIKPPVQGSSIFSPAILSELTIGDSSSSQKDFAEGSHTKKPRPTAPKPKTDKPHSVKETKDVKRNKAQLPSRLTHATPTTGDWLKKRYIVNNYILLDTLGTGSYGEVRLCKDRTTDALFAIKIISKDLLRKKKGGNTSETYFEDIKREIAIMKKLLHPNVLRLYEVLDDPNVNKMYLVVEYMKRGDLVNMMKDQKDVHTNDAQSITPLPDLELWNIFRQVVSGVRYLHYQNIVHGDIKPQNLLVSEDGVVKIADFGISKMLHASGQKLADAAGTPAFMSPELCSGGTFSGQLADVWAIGATMFMLRFGHPPFVAGNIINLYNKIMNDPLIFPAPIEGKLQDLLESMLIKEPLRRFTLQQVSLNSWLRHPPQHSNLSTSPSVQVHKDLSSPKGVYVRGNALIKEISFKPPPSYDQEEADAMKGPVKTIDNNDMFMSIGVNNHIIETAKNKNDEAYEDMMATKWGADVFEMVDDSDEGNEYDEESDDGDEEKLADTTSGVTENGNALQAKNSGVDVMSSLGGRNVMSKEEEVLRAKRFQVQLAKTSKSTPSEEYEASIKANSSGTALKITVSTSEVKSSFTSTTNNKKLDNDEETNLLSMEEFSKMMDTLAMQPKLRKEDNIPLPITLNSSDVNAPLRNLSNGVGVAFHSEQGVRESQEDRCILLYDITKMKYFDGYEWDSVDQKEELEKFSIACVFDGHSGARCSQYLSQYFAPHLVIHDKFLTKRMDTALINTCQSIDEKVCAILRQEQDSSGSTAVIAVYDGRKHILTVANVGDSMCVLSRSGRAVKLNKMHRVDDEDEKKRVLSAGGSVINGRVNGVLAITRAFGDVQFKTSQGSSEKAPVISIPDIYSEVITPMTEFCIIATDGLWDILTPQSAVNFVRKQLNKKIDLQVAAKALVQDALSNGSIDNVTCLIMSFHMSTT